MYTNQSNNVIRMHTSHTNYYVYIIMSLRLTTTIYTCILPVSKLIGGWGGECVCVWWGNKYNLSLKLWDADVTIKTRYASTAEMEAILVQNSCDPDYKWPTIPMLPCPNTLCDF